LTAVATKDPSAVIEKADHTDFGQSVVDSTTTRVTLTNWGDLAKLAAVVTHGHGREVEEVAPKVVLCKANSTPRVSRKPTRKVS